MPVSERAKQFMPFSALKGFREALAEKENPIVPKSEITEDQAELIEAELKSLKPMDQVTVIYYNGRGYTQIRGRVMRINVVKRLLIVAGNTIPIPDIYRLTIDKHVTSPTNDI